MPIYLHNLEKSKKLRIKSKLRKVEVHRYQDRGSIMFFIRKGILIWRKWTQILRISARDSLSYLLRWDTIKEKAPKDKVTKKWIHKHVLVKISLSKAQL